MNSETALEQLGMLDKLTKNMRLAAEEWKDDWQTLISIILSARTRDETTIAAANKLFKEFPNAKTLADSNSKDIEEIIRPVNYYKTKSRNIIACSKRIIEEYKGKVPKAEEDLLKLPGVGRKTANVFLSEIGKDGLGVDTHVAYISQKLGWTENSNPHKIEMDLKSLFPQKEWKKVNPILVRFGKTYISKKKQDEMIEQIKKRNLSSS
ncbi:MAG: endonuclease III [Candidatus Pacearchaeota archaeon]|nr:endonuclease III [Candidatus Pacearchaeota archaeon]